MQQHTYVRTHTLPTSRRPTLDWPAAPARRAPPLRSGRRRPRRRSGSAAGWALRTPPQSCTSAASPDPMSCYGTTRWSSGTAAHGPSSSPAPTARTRRAEVGGAARSARRTAEGGGLGRSWAVPRWRGRERRSVRRGAGTMGGAGAGACVSMRILVVSVWSEIWAFEWWRCRNKRTLWLANHLAVWSPLMA